MNSPFVLYDLPSKNDWAVTWPSFGERFTQRMKFNLLETIFKEVKCQEVGLGIGIDEKDETTVMWIKDDIWQMNITQEYSHYLYTNYNIRGAVFHSLDEAEKFKDILEKRYVWQTLQT